MKDTLHYIREFYRMPWLRAGLIIDMNGKRGAITGFAMAYVQVQFEEQDFPSNCHPTWAMTYYDEQGKVIAEYKEKIIDVQKLQSI